AWRRTISNVPECLQQKQLTEAFCEYEKWVRETIDHPIPEQKDYARLTIAEALVSLCPKEVSEVLWVIEEIFMLQVIDETDQGGVSLYGRHYKLGKNFSQQRRFGQKLEELVNDTLAAEKTKADAMRALVNAAPFPGGVLAFAEGKEGEGRLLLPISKRIEG